MNLKSISVVGSGQMGSGIAQVCAQAGIAVGLHDVSAAALQRARQGIAGSLARLAGKGKLAEPPETVLGRISFERELRQVVGSAELVVEAVFEELQVKLAVLHEVDDLAPAGALLASNTSALSITELAAATRRPERFLGLHFFNPVPLIEAVEVVRGTLTSDETFAAGLELVRQLGKEPIPVRQDVPGFLVNRVNLPSSIEAMRLVEQGVATVEEIDRGLRLALGRKMGPFETGDLVGLDVTCAALLALYRETGEERWFPPLVLRRKVKAGQLGRKSGHGWYVYGPDGSRL